MKTDLASSIGAAIAGVLIAYFICNLFIGPIEDFELTTVDSEITTELAEPSPEVFNYRALNPTVEVYVGNDADEQQTISIDVVEEDSSDDESVTDGSDQTNQSTGTNDSGEEQEVNGNTN